MEVKNIWTLLRFLGWHTSPVPDEVVDSTVAVTDQYDGFHHLLKGMLKLAASAYGSLVPGDVYLMVL